MKTPARSLWLAALASVMTLMVAAVAQDAPASATPNPSTPAETTATAPATAPTAAAEPASADTTAAAATESSTEVQPETGSATESEPAEMRRLDVPATETAETAAPETAPAEAEPSSATEQVPAVETAPAASDAPAAPQPPAAPKKGKKSRPAWRDDSKFNRQAGNERVSFWQDSTLGEGEQAGAVVSIVGSSTSAGTVSEAVVSVLGSSTSSGDVRDAVVSVLGSSRVTAGTVGDAVVSVMGNTYVNGKVGGEVVAVMGNVELGPDAEVHGDIVCVGGKVIRDASAIVHGQVNNVSVGFSFGGFEWLHAWISQCLLYARPLAFGPNLMWAWWIAIGFFVLYLVFALLFPRGVERCAETLEQRPGYSILSAFLVTLLAPAAAVILTITLVGTPALILGLFVAGLFGKAVMFAWVGRRITKLFGDSPLAHPFFAVLIGGVIILLLYVVPVVGFLVAKLTSWLGLGVVLYTLMLMMQRNRPPRSTTPVAGTPGVVAGAPVAAGVGQTGTSAAPLTAAVGADTPALNPPALATVVSAATLPRAGFWIRIAAFLIDLVVVAVLVNIFPDRWEPNPLLTFLTYCVIFWATKATTLGGIVCGLKVVRLDERKVDWSIALVRALGGVVSLIPAGLGFIWVAFDDQRQSWHDKIAGTTVVFVPKGVSLV